MQGKINWVHAISNIGLGVVQSVAVKQASSQTKRGQKKGCTPCEARAFAAQLFNKK